MENDIRSKRKIAIKRFLALLKFITAGVMTIALIVALYLSATENKNSVKSILISDLIYLITNILYLFYLIKTGRWNYKNDPYKFNIFLILGLVIHFITLCYIIYFPFKMSGNWDWSFSVIPFVLVGTVIGIYDIIKFSKLIPNKC